MAERAGAGRGHSNGPARDEQWWRGEDRYRNREFEGRTGCQAGYEKGGGPREETLLEGKSSMEVGRRALAGNWLDSSTIPREKASERWLNLRERGTHELDQT